MADSLSISDKFSAIDEAYRNQQDFTAMQVEQEATRINADTTIYSAEERALIAQLDREQQEAYNSIYESNAPYSGCQQRACCKPKPKVFRGWLSLPFLLSVRERWGISQ